MFEDLFIIERDEMEKIDDRDLQATPSSQEQWDTGQESSVWIVVPESVWHS